MKVLVVENDFNFSMVLKKKLIADGHQVRTISSQLKALSLMKVDKFDLVVTEYHTGDINGLEFVGASHFFENTPNFIFMVSSEDKREIAKCCNIGFNSYVEKPVNVNELAEKVNAYQGKTQMPMDKYFCGDLVMDLSDRTVKRGQSEIKLSYKEFELLLLLVKNKNKVVSRELIANALYDWNEYIESNAIDVYIRYLRAKIDDAFDNKMIQTIRRVGYIIKE